MSLRQKILWAWLPVAYFLGHLAAQVFEMRAGVEYVSEAIIVVVMSFYLLQLLFSPKFRAELASLLKHRRLPHDG